MNVRIPARNAFFDISCVVRHGIHTDVFYNDHRHTALDNAEEDVVLAGSLECDIEAETITIKRQRRWDIPYDKEWCNAGNFCFGRVRLCRNLGFCFAFYAFICLCSAGFYINSSVRIVNVTFGHFEKRKT